jgi:hypothetical protein
MSELLSRRTVLAGSLAAPFALSAPAQAAETDLAADVGTFVGFGEHRAGTLGERKTARWLARRLERLGFAAQTQHFPIRTVIDPGGKLTIGGQRFAVFPQWHPPVEALGRAIAGPLLPLAAGNGPPSIRLLEKPALLSANWTAPLQAHVDTAVSKGAMALIMAVDDPSDDLFVCNQHHAEPLAIPVALIARRSLPALVAALGGPATLKLTGRAVNTTALNLFGRKPGTGKAIVISTPLTGWFHCGGERGPGIALWLRAAALLALSPRPVVMLGTGSHEIGHHGMEHALGHGAPLPDATQFWLHFGASLAATRLDPRYGYRSGQYLVGTDATAALAKDQLGLVMPTYVQGSAATLGEAGQVIGAGHRNFIGMSGQFPTFHTPLDKGEAIDFAQLERIAAQVAGLLARVQAG